LQFLEEILLGFFWDFFGILRDDRMAFFYSCRGDSSEILLGFFLWILFGILQDDRKTCFAVVEEIPLRFFEDGILLGFLFRGGGMVRDDGTLGLPL